MDDTFGAPRLSGLETNDLVLNYNVDPDEYEPAWNSLNEGYLFIYFSFYFSNINLNKINNF